MRKAFFILLMLPGLTLADLSGDLTILNVRTYANGMVVQVDAPINSSCSYPNHLQLFTSNPNYEANVSLFLTGWASGKKIRVYYDGCGESGASSGSGNVYVTGWFISS